MAYLLLAFLALLTLLLHRHGWAHHLFTLSKDPPFRKVYWYDLLAFVLLYLGAIPLVRLILPFFSKEICAAIYIHPPLTLLLFLGYLAFRRELFVAFFRPPLLPSLKLSFFIYVITVPLMLFLANGLELLTTMLYGIEEMPLQDSVFLVQSCLERPMQIFLAFLAIVIVTPIVEETIFRGVIYQLFRKRFNVLLSLIFSSILFASVHFSMHQGVANLAILVSLFAFSLYIGFVYEKERRLYAPVALHALFNAANFIFILIERATSSG